MIDIRNFAFESMRPILLYTLSLICTIALSHNIALCDIECDKCFQPYSQHIDKSDTQHNDTGCDVHCYTPKSLNSNDVMSHLRLSNNRLRNNPNTQRYMCADVNHIRSINEHHHNQHQISIDNLSPERLKRECSLIALRRLVI